VWMPNVTAVPSNPKLKGDTQIQEPGRLAGAIARRAAEIRATVPDLELAIDVDAGPALALARAGDHSLTAILVRAAAIALRELPWANAAYRDGHFERYGRVNIGVVVTTEDGLVIPAVLDADTKSLSELTGELATLVARARSGELTPPEQAGTTFTLSDFTSLAAHRITPMITAPQAAALTAGAIRREPVLADGDALVAGDVMTLTLACDHRILFGERAAQLLGRIAELVREPPQ
jgi:pyruvate dehydrogenase E2 component (dihydrolipoamide acetyltransferase)